jgi:hypothetical protein
MSSNKINHIIIFFGLIFILTIAEGFTPVHPTNYYGSGNINVHFLFDGKRLQLGKQIYQNTNGDSLSIDLIKFYLSSIHLENENSPTKDLKNYFLIDAENPASCEIKLNKLNPGVYNRLVFYLGVDSLANVSGAMSGALDPANGMYWTWNTGYINAKLEGRSKQCNTLHHLFDFHIGGYLQPFTTIRKISLPIKKISFTKNAHFNFTLLVDVSACFNKPTIINLAQTNHIVLPGKEAVQMADQFAKMFLRVEN